MPQCVYLSTLLLSDPPAAHCIVSLPHSACIPTAAQAGSHSAFACAFALCCWIWPSSLRAWLFPEEPLSTNLRSSCTGPVPGPALVAAVPSAALVATWAACQQSDWAWVLQDLMGMALMALILRQFRLPNVQVPSHSPRKVLACCAFSAAGCADTFMMPARRSAMRSISVLSWKSSSGNHLRKLKGHVHSSSWLSLRQLVQVWTLYEQTICRD